VKNDRQERSPARKRLTLAIALVAILAPLIVWRCLDETLRHDVDAPPAPSVRAAAHDAKDDALAVENPREAALRIGATDLEPPTEAAPVDSKSAISIFGSVRDALSETPLTFDVELTFTNAHASRRVDVDFAGQYELIGIEPGPCQITCTAPEHRTFTEDFVVSEQPKQWRNLRLRGANTTRVSVVTPDGRSLWQAFAAEMSPRVALKIEVVKSLEPLHDEMTRADQRGPSTLGRAMPPWQPVNLPEPAPETGGLLALPESQAVYVSAVFENSLLDSKLVQPATEEVTLVVPTERLRRCTGSVRFRVVEEGSGAPMPRANAQLHAPSLLQPISIPLDGNGSALVADVPNGTLVLYVDADGYARKRVDVLVHALQVTTVADVTLAAARSLEVDTVDGDGRHVIAMVELTSVQDSEESRNDPPMQEFRDGTNIIVFPALIPRRYVLRVLGPNWVAPPMVVDMSVMKEPTLRVRCYPAIAVDLGVLANDESLSVVAVSNRLPVADFRGANGLVARAMLAPGSYRVDRWKGSSRVSSRLLEVTEGGQVRDGGEIERAPSFKR
jgi:hypothetical protein